MAHGRPDSDASRKAPLPYWSQALRALREARGITQDGWAAQLGYGRATIRRWESGETVPSADAEAAIIALCGEKRLFRRFTEGSLDGVDVTPEWIADLLAAARLHSDAAPSPRQPPTPQPRPPVSYALSGDVAIAYQVFGAGPINLVVTPGAVSHRELDWEHPGAVTFYSQLAEFARVVVFDKRGTGMSDRVTVGTLEERMDDIRAVMDAAGMERAALFGISEGGPMSILFAATYPERISSLVLYGAFQRATWRPSADELRQELDHLRQTWGTPESAAAILKRIGPSIADDPSAHEWFARYLRMGASPGAFTALLRMNAAIDVRHVLPTIRVPTLVMHRTVDDIDEGRNLAAIIPGARFVALPGSDHLPILGDIRSITRAVEAFLTEMHSEPEVDRVLATVLCIAFDDKRSRDELRAIVRRELARWRGTEVSISDRGALATFDGPTRAVRSACAIRDTACSLGLTARCGVHTGEVEMRAGGVAGDTVDLTARLARLAAPGEVLVSGMVTDLVAGSEVAFAPMDTRSLDGIPGGWRVFSAEPVSGRP